jgi:Flp pilus assembly protein TadG
MMNSLERGQRGQVLVFLAVALPMFMAMAGLAIDGALLLTTRRELQSAVDGAARAGATRLDMDLLRASGGTDIQLDRTRAEQASLSYLGQALVSDSSWQAPPTARVMSSSRRVHVVVEGRLRTAFLRIVGLNDVLVGASADADLQYGIRAPTEP